MENINEAQRAQLERKGITAERLSAQIENFKKGFPFACLRAAAVEGDGLSVFPQEEREAFRKLYRERASKEKILKFVPASGAATRMFKDLYACYEGLKAGKSAELKPEVQSFFDNLDKYAFYGELEKAVRKIFGGDLASYTAAHNYLPVLDALLEHPEGLCYGKKPKALLLFHSYADGNRQALEEHLVEGALYAQSGGVCRLHFTLSPEHREGFTKAMAAALPKYEEKFDIHYEISYSEQKSSTDTVAVKLDNEPYLDEAGLFVFRPGGHGALIENLNEREEDVIFVKNIDNVTTDALRADTVAYKELLAGVLLDRRDAVYAYMRKLEGRDEAEPALLQDLQTFVTEKLSIRLPEGFAAGNAEQQTLYFKKILDRPMRVCGMVRNTGEPGGGPFWVVSEGDKAPSLQVVESSQVDMKNPQQEAVFKTARFFNPVDLVCSVYNHKHEKYDLRAYIDPQTAFISMKSVKGTDIKAMELPGLWNGAMAKWITLFVEVPATTFTPVKTVNDLLRPQHR